jgi:hypothetical protein
MARPHGWGPAHSAARPPRSAPRLPALAPERVERSAWCMPSPRARPFHIKPLVRQHAVALERELHELARRSELDRLALEFRLADASRLARHARRVDPRARGDDRVVRLPEVSRFLARRASRGRCREGLYRVAGEEERDLVALLDGRLGHEERQRGPRGLLRAAGQVNEELRHVAGVYDVGAEPARRARQWRTSSTTSPRVSAIASARPSAQNG